MRVLAAAFPDATSALAAERRLIAGHLVAGADVEIAALARMGAPKSANVLAGTFEEHVVAAVREVVRRHGGTVVIDVDEASTHAVRR
jgi:adenine deaminase